MLWVKLLGSPVPEVGSFRLAREAQLLGLYEVVLRDACASCVFVVHKTGHPLGLHVLVLHLLARPVSEILVFVFQFA